MTADEIRQKIELQVVELLKKSMEAGTITEERAQQISQHVLQTIKPGMSLEELYRAIPKLDDRNTELVPIVLPIIKEYEENVSKKALDTVRDMIREGRYDAAAQLGKDVVAQNVKLTWQGSSGGSSSPKTQE